MKKKYLKSLAQMEKWLLKEVGLDQELSGAFLLIKSSLESVAEKEIREEMALLPPPLEIAHEPASIALYSDGGCRGNPGPGAYAFVIQDHAGVILAEGVEYEARTTNNKMELAGPIKGLRELSQTLLAQGRDPLLTKIKVITDSKYVVDGMKSWVSGWKARGWKKADNKAPENLEQWQELDQLRWGFLEVEWVWVRGHDGHPQNEYCDQLANQVMDDHSAL